MFVDIGRVPFVLGASLLDEVVRKAVHLLLDRRTRYRSVSKH